MERAERMVLVMMFEPAMAFSRTLMSPLFLMLRGMWGESRWISSLETCERDQYDG